MYINKLDEMIGIDLEWVVEDLYVRLPKISINQLDYSNNIKDMYDLQADGGTSIRNHYGLWISDSPLPTWFRKELGVTHADDMSVIIMDALWHRAKHSIYDPADTIKRLTKHWRMLGLNLDQTPIEKNDD